MKKDKNTIKILACHTGMLKAVGDFLNHLPRALEKNHCNLAPLGCTAPFLQYSWEGCDHVPVVSLEVLDWLELSGHNQWKED